MMGWLVMIGGFSNGQSACFFFGVVCFVLFNGMYKWFLFGNFNGVVLNFMDCIVYFIEIEILWFDGWCCELNLVLMHVIGIVFCAQFDGLCMWLMFYAFMDLMRESDWYFVILNYRAYSGLWPQLSFKHIYGQRAQVPGSIIIDG